MKKDKLTKRKINRCNDDVLLWLIDLHRGKNPHSKFFKHLIEEYYKRYMKMKSIQSDLLPFYKLMMKRSLIGIIK